MLDRMRGWVSIPRHRCTVSRQVVAIRHYHHRTTNDEHVGCTMVNAEAQLVPKSFEEHAEFLREYVKLHLWFTWTWLKKHPEEDFGFVIRNRVDIFRKTDINKRRSRNTSMPSGFNAPGWLNLEDRFEREAWTLFQPVVEARLDRDFIDGDGLEGFQCGSLRYHARKKFISHRLSPLLSYLKSARPPKVFFHIGNAVAPRSIFDDRSYLPRCFFQLMEETREKYCAMALTTHAWLNSYPRWLILFPEQWHKNLSAPNEEVDWSQAFWGQLVTARGTFNYKNAKIIRGTGELPYKPRKSWCSFKNMNRHLRGYLDE